MNRSTRRIIAAAAMAFACILAWPPTVGAVEGTNSITNLSVGEVTFDVASHTATVVVHLECAADIYVDARIVLVQEHYSVASRWATDYNRPDHVWAIADHYLDTYPCPAGSLDVPMHFTAFFGVYSPGPAEISGWVRCMYPAGHQTLEPTRILLHPAR